MDPITQQTVLAAAGAAKGDPLYVDELFNTTIYNGTGSSNHTITNGIDLSNEGGLVWIKSRDGNLNHNLFDTERGAGRYLETNTANSEGGPNTTRLSSFNSNGFTLGDDPLTNSSGSNGDYVSWTFRKQEKFFDIVTWDGNGTNGRTVSHNLGSVPGMIIIKSTTTSTYWITYHRSLGAGHYMLLNTLDSKSTYDSGNSNSRYFNNTAPTSTEFTLSDDGWVNGSGRSYVAYIFAHDESEFGENLDESIIKCGSYTGDGTGSANHINLGFEPQWLFVKNTSLGNTIWKCADVWRDMDSDGTCGQLSFSDNTNESEGASGITPTPTGFIAEGGGSYTNYNGSEYIYVAIRRPQKPPTVGTDVFAVDTYGPTGTTGNYMTYTSGFPVDMAISKFDLASTRNFENGARILGRKFVEVNDGGGQQNDGSFRYDYSNGWRYNSGTSSVSYSWMFRRAPTFFDVRKYDGVGGGNVSHALGVKPELIITKRLDGSGAWAVYADPLGAQYRLRLNYTGGKSAITSYWNDTEPTSSVFTVGNDTNTGGSTYKYIAYLFASCPGVSKIGTYTGDGGNNNHVFLGSSYTTQPRFVLIKAVDTSGDWVLLDSLRGNAAGYDPYVRINESTAEVTGTNVIQSGPAGSGNSAYFTPFGILNTSGETYLYLAIL